MVVDIIFLVLGALCLLFTAAHLHNAWLGYGATRGNEQELYAQLFFAEVVILICFIGFVARHAALVF